MLNRLRRMFAPADVADVMRERDSLRADLASARKQLADATALLTETRATLDDARAGLRVATAENAQLWRIVERDRARVQRETAGFHRDTALAESSRAADAMDDDGGDGAE